MKCAAFPWDTLPQSSLVVDVGGGIGGVAVKIAAAHPHLHLVVQDRPQVAALAPKIWAENPNVHPLIEQGHITFQGADVFEPQPEAYPGAAAGMKARVFVLTRVMHNWGDEDCIK